MSPKKSRRTSGTRQDALARLALGEAYLERAKLGGDADGVERTANVGIACTAGIAFSDAICLAAVGERSAGDNHADAVELLRSLDPNAAQALQTLLALKTQTQYGSTVISAEKATRAMRAAEHLAVRARQI